MAKGKLKLKRTPAEQAAHDARKARKAARRAAKRAHQSSDEGPSESYSQKRRRGSTYDSPIDLEDDAYGPPPPPSSSSHRHKVDYDEIQAQVEEERFREKLWGAFGDDERLHSVESRLNDYAHIPRRWRSGGMDRMEDDYNIDPANMEDEDYAEWIRAGMWRKKHAEEYAEQARQEAARAARLEREKTMREETKRLEREAEKQRRLQRHERHEKHWMEARLHYEKQWKLLLSGEGAQAELRFEDIPWPVFVVDVGPSPDKKGKRPATEPHVDVEDITVEAVSRFLLSTTRSDEHGMVPTDEDGKKERRDKLRETMLRFHPDKFEGRILSRVRLEDREKVQEGVRKVAIALNRLMEAK
ncbi:unnamed protein product [Somion occarium]|uniref:Uncharacterized protein n=1 Tax=Somion occarium TaxID=3059160 RepID=A0ABP1DY55_9APHY